MAWFGRREQPPADLLALLDRDERVVSWADTADSVVAATRSGVWWPASDGLRRIPWQHVDKVIWRDGTLTVTEADVVDDTLLVDREPVAVALVRPRDLPSTIRKRVEANIVRTELLGIAGGAVRFVGRRRPGHDGLTWWARIEPGTEASDEVLAAVRARLAILRAGSS